MSSRNLTPAQREKVNQFKEFISGVSEAVAIECLRKASNWSVEGAIDIYYDNPEYQRRSGPSVNPRDIEALFNKYKDADGDAITGEGIMKLCDHLGVEPSDPVMLVLAHHMTAATMGEFTKEEFTRGLQQLGCDSMDKLKRKLPELRAELKDDSKLKAIYLFAYSWSCEKGQRCVQFETAVGMWQLLFDTVRPWPLLDEWIEYLTEHHRAGDQHKAISKDTWTCLFDFVKSVKLDMSNYDETAAWPYLLDEFVDHQKAKRS